MLTADDVVVTATCSWFVACHRNLDRAESTLSWQSNGLEFLTHH